MGTLGLARGNIGEEQPPSKKVHIHQRTRDERRLFNRNPRLVCSLLARRRQVGARSALATCCHSTE